MHDANDLIEIFNDLFVRPFNTELIAGGEEPVYCPAKASGDRHGIVFCHDYFSSALHEVSHWCIAGAQRRELVDFGYWYAPDGRSTAQQKAFEGMEIKPQALEWIFSLAANVKFCVSLDNLMGDESGGQCDSVDFTRRVGEQVISYLINGLPGRAHSFTKKLLTFYQPHHRYADFCDAAFCVVSEHVNKPLMV